MSLRYALLALLTAEPKTGYDLAKAFHVSVGHVWHAPDSQIYPELRRMTRDGLVLGERVPWGPRSEKTRYRITEAGERALSDWMAQPISYTPERDPARLRAAYFEWGSPDDARAMLQAHVEHFAAQRAAWRAQLASILDRSHPTVAARLASDTRHDPDAIVAVKAFVYEGLVERAEAEIAWARRGLDLIDRLRLG